MGKSLVPSHELKVSVLSKRLSTVVELHPSSFLLSCVAERIGYEARIGGPNRFVVGATKKKPAPENEKTLDTFDQNGTQFTFQVFATAELAEDHWEWPVVFSIYSILTHTQFVFFSAFYHI